MIVSEGLIRQIELSEASAVESSARAFGGQVLRIVGGVASNCGSGNVMTQCAGCGIDEPVTGEALSELLDHYRDVEQFEFKLSPIADSETRRQVVSAAHTISEFESLLVRDLTGRVPVEPIGFDIRPADPADLVGYGRRAAARFYSGSEPPPGLAEVIAASMSGAGVFGFECLVDGSPVASCGLRIDGDVAWLAGAAVEPSHRGKGIHKALQAHRLLRAADLGCKIAVQGALAGSISQQNAQKNGFAIAFTRPTFLIRVRS